MGAKSDFFFPRDGGQSSPGLGKSGIGITFVPPQNHVCTAAGLENNGTKMADFNSMSYSLRYAMCNSWMFLAFLPVPHPGAPGGLQRGVMGESSFALLVTLHHPCLCR